MEKFTVFIEVILLVILEVHSQQCPSLPRKQILRFSCTRGNSRNSRCTFQCLSGYELTNQNNPVRTCRCSESTCSWSGRPFFCSRRVPPPPTSTTTINTTTVTNPQSGTTDETLTTVRFTSREMANTTTNLANRCPPLHINGSSIQMVDKWPTGAIFKVSTFKQRREATEGWTVLVRFSRILPENFTFMSWNSKLISSDRSHLILSNMAHNGNLQGLTDFSFAFILLGISLSDLNEYRGSVEFYDRKIANVSCLISNLVENGQNTSSSSSGENNTNIPEIISTNSISNSSSTTEATSNTKESSTTNTVRATSTSSTASTTTSLTTTETTTLTVPSLNPPNRPRNVAPGIEVDNVRINLRAVRRINRNGCNVLLDALSVMHPSYPSPDDSQTYQFNANVMITGEGNYVSDWTLKIVFSKQIFNISLWEAKFQRKSRDNHVYIIKPLSWNANLNNDFSFQIIPKMATRSIPQTVMYLCPRGIKPDRRWIGIFEPATNQQATTTTTTTTATTTSRSTTARPTRRTTPAISRRTTTQKPTTKQTRPVRRTTTATVTTRRPTNNARCRSRSGRMPRGFGQTIVNYTRSPPRERRPYDYNQVLSLSILFYEAQKSGKLPPDNRIPWRGDSGLRDGCDVGHDLTGGWYDAGDHVKFGFPMAWSVTTLAWGVIEFKEAYVRARELENMLDLLKWVTDYFIKAHTSKYEFYGQVGNGTIDHNYWGRPEEMQMNRPSYKIDRRHPGTELAAETAAALAATSVLFKDRNRQYANLLVRHAKELYQFADEYRGTYHRSIPNVYSYYRSVSGYNDELIWGALWLYKATNERKYLNDAVRKYRLYGGGGTARVFSWDDKRAGSQVLIANFTGELQYRNHVAGYLRFLNRAPTTPRGLTWLDEWGSNRYAANAAFIALAASKIPRIANKQSYISYARSQINYILGDGGRSFVVGFGRNPPKKAHHRSSSCPSPPSPCTWNSAFHSSRSNPNILYGALVAGPALNGNYIDDRTDYIGNEVAVDYNAGFQGAVAGLKYYQIQNRT